MDKIEWLYQMARDPRYSDTHRDLAARAIARAGSAGDIGEPANVQIVNRIKVIPHHANDCACACHLTPSVPKPDHQCKTSIRAQISRDVAVEFARETLADYEAGAPAGADVCMWHAQIAGRLASDCQHLLDEVTR